MKLSRIINYPLGLLGLKLARLSKIKKLQASEQFLREDGVGLISDIESDKEFLEIYERVKDFTMVGIERCYALYHAINYIVRNKLEGDLVECGVWKGGSAMLIALTLRALAVRDKKLVLFDTFEGMTQPGPQDGEFERTEWMRLRREGVGSDWCLATAEEVWNNISSTGYPQDQIELVRGKVEDTLPEFAPDRISLLRLDTDWYQSTRHELECLFPKIEKGGVLIIDDYGAWAGARKATDEYFEGKPSFYLQRIDWTGRMIIK